MFTVKDMSENPADNGHLNFVHDTGIIVNIFERSC